MNSYIARQPIFDINVNIYAYELLFRESAQNNSFSAVDEDHASSRIVMESFHTMGLNAITGGKPAFINFTQTLLEENVATLFPKEQLVVEILERVEPTPEIVRVCEDLASRGYTLAMDDFVYRPGLEPLIQLSKILKFDFLACKPDEIKEMLSLIDTKDKLLLAEKIETIADFRLAASMGFNLFQGYFFSKPITLTARAIEPLKVNYMRLLKEMNEGHDMDFGRLSDAIRDDVALSYNLLRMVNSAFYGLRSNVTDIRHALAVLGVREIRKWISLMSMIGLSANKPDELIRLSMIRGFFMEQAGAGCRLPYSTENMFLCGLFSLIDVLVDQPKSVVLGSMVLSPEIGEALLEGKGRLYDLLSLVISLERGDWEESDRLSASFGASVKQVTDLYLQSVKWCNELPS